MEDVPVLLPDDVKQGMGMGEVLLRGAKDRQGMDDRMPNFYLDSLGICEEAKNGITRLAREGSSKVDPVVSYIIAATNGNMYKHLVGKLESYPIPNLRLPKGDGHSFLDIGCSWGRWSIAAARKGYTVIGIDPSMGRIMSARRVSHSLGVPIKYLVADGRHLPFCSNSFDTVFSYNVLQHLGREDVRVVLSEVGRILKPQGTSLIQMPTPFGLRCMYHQARRRFKEAEGVEVRYWSIPALKRVFTSTIGKTEISVDCYFGLGLQKSDSEFMPMKLKLVLAGSEILRKVSHFASFLKYVADSVYVKAVKC